MVLRRPLLAAMALAPTVLLAQSVKPNYLEAFLSDVLSVAKVLKVPNIPEGREFYADKQVWEFGFKQEGADDAVAWLVGSQKDRLSSWRFGFFFKKNIG